MNDLLIQGILIDWDKISKESYLREIEAIEGLEELRFHNPVTFFVGENGTGKSTLLEAIAISAGFNPEGGTKNYSFSTFDDYSELYQAMRLIRGIRKASWGYFLRAESFYNVASKETEYFSYLESSRLHERSHGESFLEIAHEQFKPNGIYLLDEPEAALSPQRELTLLLEIYECVKEDSQFIIATHSPILLGLPGAEILSFDSGEIHPCSYQETDSYLVTEMFINHKDQLLGKLLRNEDN